MFAVRSVFCGKQQVHISNKQSKNVYDYLKQIAVCLLISVDIVKLADKKFKHELRYSFDAPVCCHKRIYAAKVLSQCECADQKWFLN